MSSPKPDAWTLIFRSYKAIDSLHDRVATQANGINLTRLRGNLRTWLSENPKPKRLTAAELRQATDDMVRDITGGDDD